MKAANQDSFAPLKFARDGDVVVWSRVTSENTLVPGEAIEKLVEAACATEPQLEFYFDDDRPTTVGVAIRGNSIAYSGVRDVGQATLDYNVWVGTEAMTEGGESRIKSAAVPGLALRPDGTLLAPGEAGTLMWSCVPAAPSGYDCARFELPGDVPDGLFDVFEIATDEDRIVTLSGVAGGNRITCIDTRSADGE